MNARMYGDVVNEKLTTRQYGDLVGTVAMLRLLGREDVAEQVWHIAQSHRPDEDTRRLNDRKRAWQWLHIEIRRRALHPDHDATEAWVQGGHIMREVVNMHDFIIELAGFGATFATMDRTPEEAIALADRIGAGVMLEPDEPPDDDEDDE